MSGRPVPIYHFERSLTVDLSSGRFDSIIDSNYFSLGLDRAGVYGKGEKRKERAAAKGLEADFSHLMNQSMRHNALG